METGTNTTSAEAHGPIAYWSGLISTAVNGEQAPNIRMHVIYRYILDKCQSLTSIPHPRILDYGCGDGAMVEAGLILGLSFYGVDLFNKEDRSRDSVIKKGLYGNAICKLDNNQIPFPDNFFDIAVSNQVLEYVSDLDIVLSEIERVLKPEGKLLCLFPTREVIRDGRCGIPFINRFSQDNKYRRHWMSLMQNLGFGCHRNRRSKQQWMDQHLAYLDKHTFYRSYKEVRKTFLAHFSMLHHIESDYISYRLRDSGMPTLSAVSRVTPFNRIARWAYTRLGGVVILAEK